MQFHFSNQAFLTLVFMGSRNKGKLHIILYPSCLSACAELKGEEKKKRKKKDLRS